MATEARIPADTTLRSPLLEGLVGYRLRRASAAMSASFAAAMEGSGIRQPLFGMLAIIAENPGSNQSALGAALGIQRANLVPLVNELVAQGWIDRRPSPTDRRAFALHLTRSGQARFRDAVKRVRAHEERLLADFDEEARGRLLELLERLHGE